jgi:hypothetical protein
MSIPARGGRGGKLGRREILLRGLRRTGEPRVHDHHGADALVHVADARQAREPAPVLDHERDVGEVQLLAELQEGAAVHLVRVVAHLCELQARERLAWAAPQGGGRSARTFSLLPKPQKSGATTRKPAAAASEREERVSVGRSGLVRVRVRAERTEGRHERAVQERPGRLAVQAQNDAPRLRGRERES